MALCFSYGKAFGAFLGGKEFGGNTNSYRRLTATQFFRSSRLRSSDLQSAIWHDPSARDNPAVSVDANIIPLHRRTNES
jgi:hypothetical protein